MKPEYFVYSKPGDFKRRIAVAGIVKDNRLHIGVAECSKKDQFNRKLGRGIALGRAIKSPQLTHDVTGKSGKEIVQLLYNILNVDYNIPKPEQK